jgi:hypothetical protein
MHIAYFAYSAYSVQDKFFPGVQLFVSIIAWFPTPVPSYSRTTIHLSLLSFYLSQEAPVKRQQPQIGPQYAI